MIQDRKQIGRMKYHCGTFDNVKTKSIIVCISLQYIYIFNTDYLGNINIIYCKSREY